MTAKQGMPSVILATGGYDKTIRFWEAPTAVCYRTLQYQDSQVNRLNITPDKQFLAVAGNPHVRLFEVNTNNPNPVTSFDGHTSNVTAVGFQKVCLCVYRRAPMFLRVSCGVLLTAVGHCSTASARLPSLRLVSSVGVYVCAATPWVTTMVGLGCALFVLCPELLQDRQSIRQLRLRVDVFAHAGLTDGFLNAKTLFHFSD